MKPIDQSFSYVLGRTKWEPIKGTVQVLDEEKCIWIARVTTTHNKAQGKEEEEFTVLATGYQYITLDNPLLPALGEWCKKQSEEQP